MANFQFRIARPLLHLLDPEVAHGMTLWALGHGLAGSDNGAEDPLLSTRVWDLDFSNPVGLAAGFDKDAAVIDAMLALGFGFVEAGTVTPEPQPGNPKPRLFRMAKDQAVINRFGFNSRGLDAFVARLKARRHNASARGIVGANVGKNRDATDAAADYAKGIAAISGLADYLVCNLSSPNTPGLRNLQAREQMREVIVRVNEARMRADAAAGRVPPLLLKVGPDLDDAAIRDIAEVALAEKVDGLIVGNTTVDRPVSLQSVHARETGGLSGLPLLDKANTCLAQMYRAVEGRLPIIGCGGIASGAHAYAKIRAGASLVQLYSALVYQGPGLIVSLKQELAALMRADGFKSVGEAVGADFR